MWIVQGKTFQNYIYNNYSCTFFCGQKFKFVLCFYVLLMQNIFMDAT